jgi:hypothetical protein
MTHDIPHTLDIETAKRAARCAVEAYSERFARYDFEARWVRDDRVELAFVVAGKRLQGAMSVLAKSLRLELDVPWMFRMFKGKAIDVIEREAKIWIDRAQRGDLPS